MAITLTRETEARLRECAEREGQDADALADAILASALADDLTEDEIAEIRAGIRSGLEAGAAGRVKSLSQAVSEVRQRHGFPDSWAREIDAPA